MTPANPALQQWTEVVKRKKNKNKNLLVVEAEDENEKSTDKKSEVVDALGDAQINDAKFTKTGKIILNFEDENSRDFVSGLSRDNPVQAGDSPQGPDTQRHIGDKATLYLDCLPKVEIHSFWTFSGLCRWTVARRSRDSPATFCRSSRPSCSEELAGRAAGYGIPTFFALGSLPSRSTFSTSTQVSEDIFS
ncbi:hypothetical protein Pcinc_009846 [Petrolisthes cinctipes]|uniref:Uncharacterized protein n=1 Tax=Petrolisthes cinctipes TaxID=88211 RepID=A0AAE1G482_PETCI|nr:hypothetical protein Pcinc_009846 [Petrolisthes cinctipes]